MTGQAVSHYKILEKLGEGGMGVVYRAADTHLDRTVALKVLPAAAMANPDRKRRFIQEAKTASSLNHSNIVTIYDIDQVDGVDFIAMEFVAGRQLDQAIGPHGMRLGEALAIGAQIADALSAAHAAGIVHRDIKPSNIVAVLTYRDLQEGPPGATLFERPHTADVADQRCMGPRDKPGRLTRMIRLPAAGGTE
jgi:serine/threonine protein kinase